MRVTIVEDGYTFTGQWLMNDPRMLTVTGPLEYRRPVRGYYHPDGKWDDGPTGRPDSPRTRRWWAAAHRLAAAFGDYRDTVLTEDE